MLRKTEQFEIVGKAQNMEELNQALEACAPDILDHGTRIASAQWREHFALHKK